MDRINPEWMSTLVDLSKIRVHFLGYSLMARGVISPRFFGAKRYPNKIWIVVFLWFHVILVTNFHKL